MMARRREAACGQELSMSGSAREDWVQKDHTGLRRDDENLDPRRENGQI